MECGSMFFLLDLDLIEYIKSCFGLSGETNNCHLIYENLSDFHFLDMEANYNSYIRYKKHFVYLHCTKYVGVFVRAWIKTSTKEISGTRNELQHRFKTDVENCDPEQTFFCHDFFESWLIKYANMKRKDGMSERSINELLQEKRKNKFFFLDKLTENKEKLETARKELIGENVQLEEGKHHGADEIDEEAWEKYIIQKKEYSHVKKYAYENLMFDKIIPDFIKNP
ncbi:hypothetical protein AVEN_171503-1 [Araneus ventricosus]|uniref:Uncharacterized protein n=1 Tax=Araneus ventricosus TaxID=182803 RepID=A0A4Y2S8C6_ARAVE|nr:hypothetical protein AVEN_171503-1 [Araneus ventricosus]